MESSENGHIGIRASPSKKMVVSIDQLKCTYTNTCSMDNKQEELETTVHLENYNIVAIMVGQLPRLECCNGWL